MIEGFEYTQSEVGAHELPGEQAPGLVGSPVLLLHGFPADPLLLAPGRAGRSPRRTGRRLRSEGLRREPLRAGRAAGGGLRRTASRPAELVELMAGLGFERFSVVGHDRGGRVAYRMALDRPDVVERLGVLNIVPTVDQFERMAGGRLARLLALVLPGAAAPFPERVSRRAPSSSLRRHPRVSWPASPDAISRDATEHYLEPSRRRRSRACAPITGPRSRSTARLDTEDRESGRRIESRCWSTGARRRERSPTPWRRGADGPAG